MAAPKSARVVPPLLPIWLPLVVAAIASGAVLAWLFPPRDPGDQPPVVRVTDVTAGSGVAFVHRLGADLTESPTTLGGGVVCFDYDTDGDSDLFFVNGADWPWQESLAKQASRGGCALYRNDGTGRFTDVSALAEVNLEFLGMAAAAGDFDNDGRPDLYVTGVGSSHLFRNRGQGRFEDITADAGVGGEANTWSTGAVWIDYDADGRLDLIVGHYARWPHEVGLDGAFAVALMGHSYGAPTGFVGVPPTVYQNLGDGRFEPVPGSAGLRPIDPASGLPAAKLLALTPLDANADGRLDLLCAFHTMGPVLFLNDGGQFRAATGPTADRSEGASAGVAVTGSLALLQAGGVDERFATWQAAMAAQPSREEEGLLPLAARLGATLLDYDGDGRIDAFTAAGLAEPDVNRFEAGRAFALPPRLWWNRGAQLVPATVDGLPELAGRGVASADFDGDGDRDFVVTVLGESPRLWRNEQRAEIPWLAIDLVATRTPREAGGARVEVHTPRRVQVQTAAPAMSLFAQSSSTLHFGLADDARVRRVVVVWPSGVRQEERIEAINQRITITER
jgi:hypothetical protein